MGGAELPSKGAALHNEGTCKPCAHHWKHGGCSNGKDCNFCHACDGDAFKRNKKDKVSALRSEGVPRRRKDKEKKGEKTGEGDEPAAEGSTNAICAAPNRSQDVVSTKAPDMVPGEFKVTYEGSGSIRVRWLVDLNKFLASRQRFSRRFDMRLW